jgi:hypothetical protein
MSVIVDPAGHVPVVSAGSDVGFEPTIQAAGTVNTYAPAEPGDPANTYRFTFVVHGTVIPVAQDPSVTPAGGCPTKLCHSATEVVGMYSLKPVALAFVTFLHTTSGPVIDMGVLRSAVYESDA